jgi:predicted  nucleic acid-binding Zn-ribbon protein
MLDWIKSYWTILITLAGWVILLVKDHNEIKSLKQDVKYLQDNFDIKEIEAMKKGYENLENRYADLSSEISSIKTLLSEISTKVTLLVNGKININGE